MLIYSMSVPVDRFIADREGAFGWTDPGVDADPSLRDNKLGAAFADVWCAMPKVVSRTLDCVQGNVRLAGAWVAEEAAAALDAAPRSSVTS
jgi:hypothetical protein